MPNNRDMSPDCDNIGFESDSPEISLRQQKYSKNLETYK